MSKTAFIFPGQGGQFVGQGTSFLEILPSLKEFFTQADQITGLPISKLCLEGPLEELSQTVNLQPAVLTVSLAAAKILAKQGFIPDIAAGHSLGEFGALCLSGVLSETEVLTLVTKRAQFMQKATSEKPGAMSAILNLDQKVLEGICELARAEGQVVMANFNTPQQTVISGEVKAVAAAVRYVALKGGRSIALPLSGAFHSPLMEQAAKSMAEEVKKLTFKTPLFPVIPNALGKPVTDPKLLKNLLISQMTSPVLWTTTVESLVAFGVTNFLECWPKLYLGSMVKKNLPPNLEKAVILTPKQKS
jgi:[acyl-carrier-protein] S-malonyltransferase